MRVVRRVGYLVVFSLLCVGANAQGQITGSLLAPRLDRSFDIQLFHPAVGAHSFVTLDSAEVLEHRLWHFGLVASYLREPLSHTLSTLDSLGNLHTATVVPVRNLAMAELVAAVGLFNRFEVGAALPLAYSWDGDRFNDYGGLAGYGASVWAAGDLRVEAKAELVGFGQDRPFLLSVSAGGTFPTSRLNSADLGEPAPFLGNGSVTGRVRALLEYQRGEYLRVLAMAGGYFRERSQFLGTPQGHAALYGAAVEVQPTSQIAILGEATGRIASQYFDTNPAELDLAMRFYLPSMLNLLMGAGFGLNHGIGSPVARGFVGLGWAPDPRDRDHDGVIDVLDRCPDEAEDRDGYQDSDGCPDPDNDFDDIPDAVDKCPNEPEDFDGFQDEDGCPDPDNDGDGIPDLQDACPNEKEDGKGKRPTDGCPSTAEDSDGDGVPDVRDKCADEPEDKDGFQDDDGCPDYDNDGDGIPDIYDACPNEPEDMDGFQDDDGCPDPDNDHDGIPDAKDKCPNQPETINNFRDDDGCPDPGAEIVRLGEDDAKIYLAEHINFFPGPGGKPALTTNSHMLVDLVARAIKNHPELAKVRIDVRGKNVTKEETEERGQLVLQALVKHGVDAQKLKVSGLGPGPNRVEFVIESRNKAVRNPVPIPTVAPAEAAPAETAPAETAPAETAPAETAPAETAPAETAPAETAPSGGDASPAPAPPAKEAR
jgi:OOP family OmpA-OmpF porin